MILSGAVFEIKSLDEQKLRITVGKNLRKIRKEKGLTMVMIGHASHCSQSFLSKVESGGIIPSLPMLQRLSRALGVKASSLLGEDDQSIGDYTEERLIVIEQDP